MLIFDAMLFLVRSAASLHLTIVHRVGHMTFNSFLALLFLSAFKQYLDFPGAVFSFISVRICTFNVYVYLVNRRIMNTPKAQN